MNQCCNECAHHGEWRTEFYGPKRGKYTTALVVGDCLHPEAGMVPIMPSAGTGCGKFEPRPTAPASSKPPHNEEPQ